MKRAYTGIYGFDTIPVLMAKASAVPAELEKLCIVCIYGPPEEFQTGRPTWSQILQCVLFALKCLNPTQNYFALKSDIVAFIEDHWDMLNMQKDRTLPWQQTVKMTLSRYRDVFINGYADLRQRGFWKIKSFVNPYNVSSFTIFEKEIDYTPCSFSVENSRQLYEDRKQMVNSIPKAEIIKDRSHRDWDFKPTSETLSTGNFPTAGQSSNFQYSSNPSAYTMSKSYSGMSNPSGSVFTSGFSQGGSVVLSQPSSRIHFTPTKHNSYQNSPSKIAYTTSLDPKLSNDIKYLEPNEIRYHTPQGIHELPDTIPQLSGIQPDRVKPEIKEENFFYDSVFKNLITENLEKEKQSEKRVSIKQETLSDEEKSQKGKLSFILVN